MRLKSPVLHFGQYGGRGAGLSTCRKGHDGQPYNIVSLLMISGPGNAIEHSSLLRDLNSAFSKLEFCIGVERFPLRVQSRTHHRAMGSRKGTRQVGAATSTRHPTPCRHPRFEIRISVCLSRWMREPSSN